MRKVRELLVISLIMSMSFFWFDGGAFAGPRGNGCYISSRVAKTHNHVIRISPRPPGWPQMWLAREIIKSFNENGLRVEKTKEEEVIEKSDLPAKTRRAIKSLVSFNAQKLKGCVLEFDKKKNFNLVKDHYLELNEKNELNTWSLVKDNILVIFDGAMPDREIRKYEAVLAGMK